MRVHISQFPVGGCRTLEVVVEADTSRADWATIVSMNITLSAVERERNRLALAFNRVPVTVGMTARVSHELPEQLTDGLYAVAARVSFNRPGDNSSVATSQEVFNCAFLVADGILGDQEAVATKITELERARFGYLNAALRTKASSNGQSEHFSVDFFCAGSLIHGRQDLEGYAVIPLDQSFNYGYMLDPINSFEQQSSNITVQFSAQIQALYERDSPLFVIAFKDVIATSYEDAESHCWALVDNINTILTLKKGHRPKAFATISRKLGCNKIRQVIYHEGYRGNLIPGFGPTEIADTIEFKLPVLLAKPRIKLLYQSYADALSEQNPDFAYFKFWTLLELVADARVHDICNIRCPNGDVIMDTTNAKPVTTKYAAGKVYQLLFGANLESFRCSAQDETYIFGNHTPCSANENETLYSLWDITCGLYEIRNATAHEGQFDAARVHSRNRREQLASELYRLPDGILWRYVKWVVSHVIENEMRLAAASL